MGSNLLKRLKRWWLWLDDDKVTGGNSAHTCLSPPTSSALQGGHARNTSPTVGGAQEASLHVEEYHAIRRFCRASALCGSGGGHRWSDPTCWHRGYRDMKHETLNAAYRARKAELQWKKMKNICLIIFFAALLISWYWESQQSQREGQTSDR